MPILYIQLSAVGELLSQLLTTDREALVQDTNTLRETIATLQAQLQVCTCTCYTVHVLGIFLFDIQYSVQTEQVDEENTQLRKKCKHWSVVLVRTLYSVS